VDELFLKMNRKIGLWEARELVNQH